MGTLPDRAPLGNAGGLTWGNGGLALGDWAETTRGLPVCGCRPRSRAAAPADGSESVLYFRHVSVHFQERGRGVPSEGHHPPRTSAGRGAWPAERWPERIGSRRIAPGQRQSAPWVPPEAVPAPSRAAGKQWGSGSPPAALPPPAVHGGHCLLGRPSPQGGPASLQTEWGASRAGGERLLGVSAVSVCFLVPTPQGRSPKDS